MEVILISGIFLSLFIVVLLLTNKQKALTDKINVEYIIYLIIIGFVFYIGYYGIKHENIFTNNPQIENSGDKESEPTEKYKNSGIKTEVASKLHDNLLKIMAEQKPYLNPKLSLAGLARQLEISTNQLSQVINQQGQVNFHDFVNEYRVEEFIQNAKKNKNFSLLALALDSGFNSKSSFNTIFKKQKGGTPSQYLSKQVQKDTEG